MLRNDHPQNKLHQKRAIILEVSFIIVLLLVIMAFKIHLPGKSVPLVSNSETIDTFFIVDITKISEQKKLPETTEKAKEKPLTREDKIRIDDDKKVDDDKTLITPDDFSKKIPDETGSGVIELPKPVKPVTWAGEMPAFPGGMKAFYVWLGQKLKYPSCNGFQEEGTVYVQFVVDEQGNISDINIERGLCKDIDNAVKRVLEQMPQWKPGKNNGKTVPVLFTLPVTFKTTE